MGFIHRLHDFCELVYVSFVLLLTFAATLRYFPGLADELGIATSSGTTLPLDEFDPVCQALEDWIEDEGGMVDGVKCFVTPEGGGRGIMSTTNLPYRRTYISVPPHLYFQERTVKANCTIAPLLEEDTVVKRVCGDDWGVSGEPCRLILAMMYEQGHPDSFWRPYLDSMPEIPTSPIYMNDEQMDDLQSPSLKRSIKELQGWLNRTYDGLFPYLEDTYPQHFPRGMYTVANLTWSALHVWGRAFDSDANDPDQPARRTWGMIPFADLVNHQSYVESFYGDNDGVGPFECWATECFAPGEELFQSYGSHKSSAHYFLYYGFVPRGYLRSDFITLTVPEHDRVIVLNFTDRDELIGIDENELTGFAGTDGQVNEAFIEAYRQLLIRGERIPAIDMNETKGYGTVLKQLLTAVSGQLDSYPTTFEQDYQELQAGWPGYDRWVALTIRSRFKFVMMKVQENLLHRLETDPANQTAWKDEWQDWLLVNDDEEVNTRTPEHNIRESMAKITVTLPDDPKVPEFVNMASKMIGV